MRSCLKAQSMEPAESFLFRMHQVLMSPDCRPFIRHHDAVCRQFAAVHLLRMGSRKMRNGFTELNLSVKNAALIRPYIWAGVRQGSARGTNLHRSWCNLSSVSFYEVDMWLMTDVEIWARQTAFRMVRPWTMDGNRAWNREFIGSGNLSGTCRSERDQTQLADCRAYRYVLREQPVARGVHMRLILTK